MKLTEEQKELLKDYDWDVVNNDSGNCTWISVRPEDGKIFGEICETFNLTGGGNVDLLVVGHKEHEIEE